MNARSWIAIGATSAGLAVGCGAFGAHALKDHLEPAALELWRTAVLYQVLHAIALVQFGLFRRRDGTRNLAGWSFFLGQLVFASTVYGLALGGPRVLGAITPIGGVLLIVGWIDFALQALAVRGE